MVENLEYIILVAKDSIGSEGTNVGVKVTGIGGKEYN